jgi:hypothetical protein
MLSGAKSPAYGVDISTLFGETYLPERAETWFILPIRGSGSYDVHDEAVRLISEHCEGGYVETHRQEYGKYRKIYIACLQADGSPPQSSSCIYVPPEEDPVGFGNYDPANVEW